MRGEPEGGYEHREPTKPPNWHGLVAWDLLLNNLTTGLFLATALGELTRPGLLGGLARAAYPLALAFLTLDLLCLVLDLGDPLRFHHMLRVVKLSSPMSLGTWCLTIYSIPLAALAAMEVVPGLRDAVGHWRWAVLAFGVPPALGSMLYKGVLFSTSSQPGWRDARWLATYLSTAAPLLGLATLLAIALVARRPAAVEALRMGLGLAIVVNSVPLGMLALELSPTFRRAVAPAGLVRLATVALGLGTLVPLGLCLATGSSAALGLAIGLVGVGGLAIRTAVVKLPHGLHH